VPDADQVAAAFASARERFGPLSQLVNNAGQADSAPFLKTDAALLRQMVAVNQTGYLALGAGRAVCRVGLHGANL
jgi:NAD(P)-dependent dehydrogenase (short-subunit alcohol dehydrogenase family)